MTTQETAAPAGPTPRQLAVLSLPAALVGALSAAILWALNAVSGLLESAIWDTVPALMGVSGESRWWIFVVLTTVGAAVGLVVWKMPGHGGRDSATTELIAPPLPLGALPSLTIAVMLTLAGGVSLGPENPIIAINTALAVVLVARLAPGVPQQMTVAIAAAGTIGALFGTPVAAALVFTGVMAASPGAGALWDRLFLPLVAAGVGALTMRLLDTPDLSIALPAYGPPQLIDLLSGSLIACLAALVSLPIVAALPVVHRFFHRMRNPLVYTTLGGLVLGGLGAIGGQMTLFKGLEQTGELLATPDAWTAGTLVLFAVIKLLALLVAAAAGFRGGRIFPALFVGVTLGLLAHDLVPAVPVALAVACAVLGVVLAVARDGWVALFVAVAVPADMTLLPVLCVVILPCWLLVSNAPAMVVEHPWPEQRGDAGEK